MKIEVTCDDIMQGVPSSSASCPVALAIKRATGSYRVFVSELIVTDTYEGYSPLEVRNFIKAFDSDGKVTPFTFEL